MLPHLYVIHITSICIKDRSLFLTPILQDYFHSHGLETHALLGGNLVSMLAGARGICNTHKVVHNYPLSSWNNVATDDIPHKHPREALAPIQNYHSKTDACNFVALLKSCARLKDLERGRDIHLIISRSGLLKRNLFVSSMLVDMYAKCGSLSEAQEVFDTLPIRDVVTWTALIAGYVQNNRNEEALNRYEQMQLEGVSPNAFTFSCILKACGSFEVTDKGREIHATIASRGFLQTNCFVASALIDMYAKCGNFVQAEEIFAVLSVRDTVSWTALISGYTDYEHGVEALNCFDQMQHEGASPSAITYACVLKACGIVGDIEKGRDIHCEIAKKGLLKRDLVLGNSLIDMYAKCGLLAEAKDVFSSVQVRDIVSWTALIAGYTDSEMGEEACVCFIKMQLEGVSPDAFTFACCLKACGNIGVAERGKEIHADIEKNGSWKRDLVVGTALVDMYAKCGLLDNAQEVFNKLLVRDEVLWNSLVAGYSQHGDVKNVFCSFARMRQDGFDPHPVTFTRVINACSHAGLLEEGQMCFEIMRRDYGITPVVEHHTCMVDLFSRAGQLEKAVALMVVSPCHPNMVMLLSILGACRKWNNLEMGRQVFQEAVGLDQTEPSAYVGMYNLYAEVDMQEDVDEECLL